MFANAAWDRLGPLTETHQEFDYKLDDQLGFALRQVNQRHLSNFSHAIKELTPTQFGALAKIREIGAVSQNDLGRQTAVDAATMKGVVDRLVRRELVSTKPDPHDQRRLLVELTATGRAMIDEKIAESFQIAEATLAPLKKSEKTQFIRLLNKILEA